MSKNNEEKADIYSTATSKIKMGPEDEKLLYLECLGHLMGLQFKPKAGLELVNSLDGNQSEYFQEEDNSQSQQGSMSTRSSQRNNKAKDKSEESVITVNDLSLSQAKNWKTGAVAATLSKFGMSMQPQESPHTWESFVLKDEEQVKENNKYVWKLCTTTKNCEVQTDRESNLLDQQPPRSGLSKTCKNTNFKVPMKRTGGVTEVVVNNNIQSVGGHSSSRQINGEDGEANKRPKLEIGHNFPSTSAGVNPPRSLFSTCSAPRKGVENANANIKPEIKLPSFQSALQTLITNDKKKGIKRNLDPSSPEKPSTNRAKTNKDDDDEGIASLNNPELEALLAHEKLKVFEPKIVEAVLSEVMEEQQITNWDDIAGLVGPKAVIREIIIWPMLRPDIFTGLRSSPKGILLFGPPGTGKTMIGRLIATQSNSTFFNISASSLTSKWIGDGEKMVRCLFQVARIKQPSVIFIDEIDSILTQRSDTEHESSRRLKTEFLIQFDGCATKQEDRVLVIGVTNRPQELDEAARRRLVKRIYIPLPDIEGRKQIVQNLMVGQNCKLNPDEINKISEITEGYSGADMRSLCQEASYGPIRDIGHMLENICAENVRAIELKDFFFAVKRVKSSVALKDLDIYEEWDKSFGCHGQS